jgi:phosphohistidine swiveling domain-containing protein
MSAFLIWEEAFEAGPAICGGKAYNLACLHRYGFPVPRGGVLSAGADASELRNGIERLGLAFTPVAVRSSATGEDSDHASFAGIHRSFLNVSGLDEIERAAQGCIDSLNAPAAIAYRRHMGFSDQEVRCAVVVCEMVQAQCAGVLFTCDPLSGRRDRYIINASAGLGESVVSGSVNPDRAVWQRERWAMKRAEGPQVLSLLPREQEERLVHVAQRVHWALGEGQNPQDIEWAWDSNQLWLLQARPVTKLPRPVWPVAPSLPVYWSTANIKDAVPGVVCELSWSNLCDVVGDVAYAAQKAAGYQMPPGIEVMRRIKGRGFFDLTAMQWAFYDAFGILPKEIVKIVGGYQPEIEVPANPFRGAEGSRRKRAVLRLLRRIWNFPAVVKKTVDAQLDLTRRYASIDWSRKSRAEMSGAIAELLAAQHNFLPVAGLANSCNGPWDQALRALLKDDTLIARLQAGCGGVASAEQGYRLFEIAAGKATIEDFLRDFGHRCVYEADLVNPRWAEDSAWVWEQVEAIRSSRFQRDPRSIAAETRRNAEQELRKRVGWKTPIALWLVSRLRAAIAARENAKSALVAVMLPVRQIALEVGRRLVAESRLASADQVFDFSKDDLLGWLTGEWDGKGASALTGDRIERRKRWLKEDVPDLITEEPAESLVPMPESAPVQLDDQWIGIPVSPGIARGTAQIIRTPKDAAYLREGDVLVAPSTDPGWTPLFLRACAIVMETGGFLSHGAIVAREYGLPAVANIPSILSQLESGEWIEVDGTRGTVRRIENKDA